MVIERFSPDDMWQNEYKSLLGHSQLARLRWGHRAWRIEARRGHHVWRMEAGRVSGMENRAIGRRWRLEGKRWTGLGRHHNKKTRTVWHRDTSVCGNSRKFRRGTNERTIIINPQKPSTTYRLKNLFFLRFAWCSRTSRGGGKEEREKRNKGRSMGSSPCGSWQQQREEGGTTSPPVSTEPYSRVELEQSRVEEE
eukprot:scaffold146196_cov31-Tisochrysis_lutea.AAC.3